MTANGCILRDTPIVVDLWNHPKEFKVFFLTHLHLDHIANLTSSWRFPFYTSPINKLLLHQRFQFADNIVIPLEIDEPHLVPADAEGKTTMTVTLINANHIPGAVMFFFQGEFGNILYTGDFRFYPEIFAHPILSKVIQYRQIDRLYLDNTFAKQNYNFPTRKEATEELFKIIDQHPKHTIKLGIRNIGKEDLLEELAQKYQELIYVDAKRYQTLKVLRRPNVYTTDSAASRIHVLNLYRFHRTSHEKWNEFTPTISILLTAIYYGLSNNRFPFNTDGVFVVPYSDHSSWQELEEFVIGIKPRKIIPIVKDNKKSDFISLALRGREDMSYFDTFLSSPFSSPVAQEKSCGKMSYLHSPIQNQPLKSSLTKEKNKMKKKRRRALSKGVMYASFEEKGNNNDSQCIEPSNVLHSTPSKEHPPILTISPITHAQQDSPAHLNETDTEQFRDHKALQKQALEKHQGEDERNEPIASCIAEMDDITDRQEDSHSLEEPLAKATSAKETEGVAPQENFSNIKAYPELLRDDLAIINNSSSRGCEKVEAQFSVSASSTSRKETVLPGTSTRVAPQKDFLKIKVYPTLFSSDFNALNNSTFEECKNVEAQLSPSSSMSDLNALNNSSFEECKNVEEQLSPSSSRRKERQDLLNKAVEKANNLVDTMKKNPQVDLKEVFCKGFELCNLLENVKDVF